MIQELGAFHYFSVVPSNVESEPAEWPLLCDEHNEHKFALKNPFGTTPTVSISAADPPANANPKRPYVNRSRFMLEGNGCRAAFHIDRSIVSRLLIGDIMHIVRTQRGGLGLSVLRGNRLIVAFGAITAVPLGEGIAARVAPELRQRALSEDIVFAASLRPGRDAFENRHHDEWPLEVEIGSASFLSFSCSQEIEGIKLFIYHGFYFGRSRKWWQFWKPESIRGVDGKDECAALTRIEQSSWVGANASALLLETDGLESV
jgi:hypothetical protein